MRPVKNRWLELSQPASIEGHARVMPQDDPITDLPGGRVLARVDYEIAASRERVWDLLPASIIQCMPVEQMDILDESSFNAVLNVKISLLTVPFRIRVRAADIQPMTSLGTRVTVSKGGFQSSLSVSYSLFDAGEERTRISSIAKEDNPGGLMRLLRGQQRRFARQMFEAIREDLERNLS